METIRVAGRRSKVTFGGIVVVTTASFILLALIVVPVLGVISKAAEENRRAQCANNLKTIGGAIKAHWLDLRVRPRPESAGILFAYNLGLVHRGDERAFVCPLDPAGADRMEAWSGGSVLPTAPGAADVLTSYLYPDYGTGPYPSFCNRKWAIAACLNHPGGVLMLYDDNTVAFHDREALGLGPGDPIETGPNAKDADLRAFPARRAP